MALFKKILCFVVLAQIILFANNAMAECYKYNYIGTIMENYPEAQSDGTYGFQNTNCQDNGGVYYNTATNTYVSVHQCSSCELPAQLVPKTTTLNNGCVATYQDCDLVCNTSTTNPGGSKATTYSASNCSSTSTYYSTIENVNVYWTVESCNTCNSGYYRYQTSAVNGAGCAMAYYDCDKCVKTPSYGTWRSVAGYPGYERRVVSYTWNNSACGSTPSDTYEIRCAAGYYGTPTSVTSGCTKCGQIEGIDSTSDAGSTSCTACCVPGGATGSSDAGSFIIQSACCFTSC